MAAAAVHDERSPRRRLLDAGLELFGTVGYEATTISDLCREARVSTRDFYRHAGDRIDLFLALFEQEVERVIGPVTAALDRSPPVWEVRARIWTEQWLQTMVADARRYRVLYTEAIGVSPALEERRREVLRSNCRLCARHLALCAEARGERRPPGHYDAAGVAIMGAARELLLQYMEGALGIGAPGAVGDAVVHLGMLVGEGW